MFDPSKLNLDLDNLDNNEDNKEEETQIKNTNSKNQNNNSKANDPLENLELDKNSEEEIKIQEENTIKETKTSQLKEEKKEEDIQNIKEENKKEEKIKDKTKEEQKEIKKEEQKIIFDINLNSVETLLDFLIKNKYDFLTIEPDEEKVKINFFKDKILKETKYIKYPIYSQLIIKLKNLTKLKIEITDKSQE
jgi:type II secretory ATPase GspE/PulE/Tfp pilus assembly ATPase PilB-like protein